MSFPNFNFWWHLLVTVSVEVCGLAALGLVAQRFFRSAVWQRAVWQMIVLCLLLLPASEWTGFSRGTASFLFGQKRAVDHVPASGFAAVKSVAAPGLVAATLDRPPAAAQPALWWPGWIWLAGATIVLGRMAAAQVLLLALRVRREKIATQSLRQRVLDVARSVGLRRKVSLLRMPQSISPMAFGILRPSIGLPPGFETNLSATEQEAVLAHELAHLAAMDPLWFLLADFASAWLWWHPLAWCVRRWLHGAAELAADEATAIVPDGPGALANCLVSLGKQMTAARGWSWVGINGGFRSKLGQRVERLMRLPGGAKRPLAGWAGTAAKLAATILVVPAIVLLFGSFQSAPEQKEDSWRGQLRKSWNSSPGGLLMPTAFDHETKPKVGIAARVEKAKLLYERDKLLVLAALDDKAELKADIAAWVTRAKLLYEMGKYDDAEAVLEAVMKEDHANRSAAYYLDLIKEARYMDSLRRQEGLPGPIPMPHTHLTPTGADSDLGAPITAQLPLPHFRTRQVSTTSSAWDEQTVVVGGSNSKTISRTGRKGILSKLNSIVLDEVSFDQTLPEVVKQLQAEAKKRDPDGLGINFMINPRADAGVGAPPAIELSQVRIKISPPLRRVRMADVLDAMTKVADAPIWYSVDDYAVVFWPKPPEAAHLYTKVFKVDPNTFVQGLANVSVVNLNPTASATGGNGSGSNPGATIPSVQIAPPAQGSGSAGLNDGVGANVTEDIGQALRNLITASGVDLSEPGKAVVFDHRTGAVVVSATATDLEKVSRVVGMLIQTPPQVMIVATFTDVEEAWLQGLVLDWNKNQFTGIMTDKQFRATLAAIEQHPGAVVLATPKVTTESGRQAHMSSLDQDGTGVAIDVLATVGPDGYSIQTAAFPTIKTGHETWQTKASRQVLDGETLVMGGVLTNQLAGPRKLHVVFVTSRIMDPTGNPVRTDEEISKRPGLPSQ
jgi:beta-lactamase regulating signal transducer with metallopeptidase domain